MVLYPNKLPESERVCSGICTPNRVVRFGLNVLLDETETCGRFGLNDRTIPAHLPDTFRGSSESLRAFKKTFRCFRQNASAFYLKRFGVFSNENCPAPTFLFRLLQGRLITSKSRYLYFFDTTEQAPEVICKASGCSLI